MTILVAVTAAFAHLITPTHANAVSSSPPIPRVTAGLPAIRPAGDGQPPRYLRLRLEVTAYGIRGRGAIEVDRATGRYVRRLDAGPASEREGWDGEHPWRADATGMPRIEGNSDERAAIVEWSRMLAPGDVAPRERPVRQPEVAADPLSGQVAAVLRHIGHADQRTTFGDYRAANGMLVPFAISDSSENGTWTARVLRVETPRTLPRQTFAPPAQPRDAVLDDVDAVPLTTLGMLPTIAVRIDDGPALRFVLDTGGQNVITPQAARRSGLDVLGEGTVGGAGPRLAKVRYANARSVRIGRAALRGQPFLVLDLGAAGGVDGIVGYELLARLGARLDVQHERLQLAADASALVPSGVRVPMVLDDRQPQVEGAIDGLAGPLTIDTGSASAVDVNAPFVAAHDLRTRYHAETSGFPISGVGGPVHAYFAHANEIRIGAVAIPDVSLLLTDARAGVESDPTIAGNVGMQVLRRFSVVFDYRRSTLWFETPAP